jgi:serine O-acetyltransferase
VNPTILWIASALPAALFLMYFYLKIRSTHTITFFEKAAGRRGKGFKFITFLALIVLDRSIQALVIYRLSHKINNPIVGRILTNLSFSLTGIEIYYNAKIARGVEIWHGQGTVIGQNSVVGENTLILHQVTIGSGFVVIGERVRVGTGAKILGTIKIGDDCVIGANAVITKSLPDRTLVVADTTQTKISDEVNLKEKFTFGTKA